MFDDLLVGVLNPVNHLGLYQGCMFNENKQDKIILFNILNLMVLKYLIKFTQMDLSRSKSDTAPMGDINFPSLLSIESRFSTEPPHQILRLCLSQRLESMS